MNTIRQALCYIAITLAAVSAACGGQPAQSPTPDKAEAGRAACHTLLDGFDLYPLVYLGDDFEGNALLHCQRSGAGPTISPTDQVTFIYGTCVLSGGDESSCVPPLQVHVYPECAPTASGATFFRQIRGIEVSEIGQTLLATPPGYKVTISVGEDSPSERSETAARAFESLRGANAAASSITTSSRLDALASAQPAPQICP